MDAAFLYAGVASKPIAFLYFEVRNIWKLSTFPSLPYLPYLRRFALYEDE
jgi:hypothetical protein